MLVGMLILARKVAFLAQTADKVESCVVAGGMKKRSF
jgi:hypothetical protein